MPSMKCSVVVEDPPDPAVIAGDGAVVVLVTVRVGMLSPRHEHADTTAVAGSCLSDATASLALQLASLSPSCLLLLRRRHEFPVVEAVIYVVIVVL